MMIRCKLCGAENSVADPTFARQSRPAPCYDCGAVLPAVGGRPSLGLESRQEGSGLLDIRAMAVVLGASARSGTPVPGPADEVAVSSRPELRASLPTAGVIMPMAEPDRPWWLVPSLAVGGTLLVAVVALLAVILLQPTRTSRASGGDSAPGKAAANGAALANSSAPANIFDPGPSRKRIPERLVAKIAVRYLAINTPRVLHATSAPAPAPEAKRDARRSRKVNLRKRRHGRDRKNVVKPVRATKVTRPKEPRNRPRSITEILMDVGKSRPGVPKAVPRVTLPAKLGRRTIQGGMSRVMGAARACGRRFSTSGRVSVRLVIAGSTGRVLSVSPKGAHAGSLTGRCVSRALRSARFKPFARSRQSFYYTVILR